MLHITFQTSKWFCKRFIFIYFYGLNIGPPGLWSSCTQGPSFEQTWSRTTRQSYIANFKHLSRVVLKKKIFEYFSMYFYGSNLGYPGKEPSWILGPHLNKIGKGLLGNATTQFQASKPSGSEKEIF